MDSLVKKSLAAPIKQLTCCVTGAKDNDNWVSRTSKNLKGGKGQNGLSRTAQAKPDPALIRSYQADLEKERQAPLRFVVPLISPVRASALFLSAAVMVLCCHGNRVWR